jgi:catechol 2,3-dioxygenase-like lactoylglutathione lyase family enzyme
MSADLTRLFHDFDRGRVSRRQLLEVLGIAIVIRPAPSFAQGQCGGTLAGTPQCDTTPAKLPFEPTGWKTVRLDHFSCQAVDYRKEAAFYAALMNWKINSDDGNQAVLQIGNLGSLVLRGGYQAPQPATDRAGAPRPRLAAFDGFCWGISPWDAKKVETELRKRNLTPVADNDKDFQSFHVKDPDGFNLQISNGKPKRLSGGSANAKTAAPSPFESTNWNTVWLDHISFTASNYKESVAFYAALLGWKPGTDEGSQTQCEIGDVGNIIIRRGRGGNQGAGPIDHISFGISPFDPDQVRAELEKRGLTAREDTGGRGDIHTATHKSYHTTTPNGFDLQISATTKSTRNPFP